ncbi:phenylacetate-CoA ligase [Pseudobutyrivibrio sp. ACV-2]|uniref:phenylacetate--CoA ligase family protein n=1 Tax=Pseudobutyrivibrio sp. ACV-2 TaxID=1520801 RepID=UPI000897D6FB|nr:phenylacetate--CoA ligase [Pseudobutyrivibrio sp. ACV-2]SEA97128.1 phenylacetate-CoA ligase [Pseudobutyrivibrio sp. ACV-2]
MGYFQESIETMDVDKLKALQNKRFCDLIKRTYRNVPFYKKKLEDLGIVISEINGIEDITKLPFMTKDDLRINYPDKLLAVPQSEIVKAQSTSGTTGKPVISFYTKHDVSICEDCCARAIVAAGGCKKDVCQVSFGYGLFSGGAGLDGGSQRVGCLTLPMSTGNTRRQAQFMIDLGTSILCSTPSYAASIGEYIDKNNLKKYIKLKAGIFGAEPWSNELRNKIEEELEIDAYDIYGLTEMMGPGVAFECSQKDGMHIQEDHFFAEVVNPEDGHVLPNGEVGELVLTTLTKEAVPLVRYRTHDLCRIYRDKCSCGRTHIKMSKLLGRTDDMVIVKGVNIWPSQVETVLIRNGYTLNYNIVISREDNNDFMDIDIENSKRILDDNQKEQEIKYLINEFKDALGIKVNIHLIGVGTLQRSEGKAKKVFDKRNLYEGEC